MRAVTGQEAAQPCDVSIWLLPLLAPSSEGGIKYAVRSEGVSFESR